MDVVGVEKGLMVVMIGGWEGFDIYFEKFVVCIQQVIDQYLDCFKGFVGVNLLNIVLWMKYFDYVVCEFGFVGVYFYFYWFGYLLDYWIYYFFYVKCVEFGVFIQIQIGYLVQDFLVIVVWLMMFDCLVFDFFELMIIGIYIGYLWMEELIFVVMKYKNVFIGCDVYVFKYWELNFVCFILLCCGMDKVFFGIDWLVIGFECVV